MRSALPKLVLVMLMLSACTVQNPTGNSPEASKIIQMGTFSNAIGYAPYLVAKEKGWFDDVAKKYGAKIEYTQFQTLPPINEAFATGKADIVFEAEPPAIIGRAAGIDTKILDTISSRLQDIIVPTGSTITKVSELKGKKMAILSGTSAHYGVMKLLEINGLSSKDVQIIDMAPPDARAAFESGQIDAWAAWPPWVEQEEIAGKGHMLGYADVTIQAVMVARNAFMQENPDLMKDMLDVVSRMKTWTAQNPDEAQSIVSKALNLSPDVVAKAWPRHNFEPTIGAKEAAVMQDEADFLFRVGLVKNQVNVQADMLQLK